VWGSNNSSEVFGQDRVNNPTKKVRFRDAVSNGTFSGGDGYLPGVWLVFYQNPLIKKETQRHSDSLIIKMHLKQKI
jgi:hypothetical protein